MSEGNKKGGWGFGLIYTRPALLGMRGGHVRYRPFSFRRAGLGVGNKHKTRFYSLGLAQGVLSRFVFLFFLFHGKYRGEAGRVQSDTDDE